MATKTNSKPCQTSAMEPLPQFVIGFRGKLQTSKMELFLNFFEKPPTWMFDKALNMLLNWLSMDVLFLNQFKYQR